ncbi:adenosine deaminase/editase [Hypomontagnella monticulosa]|nr:adenosine deaminase/editase [Hypomontagnella monticulosa]
MTITADDIAALVQKHYDALPAKRKPVVRNNGLREWVPLAGIVAQGEDDKLWCLSIATGMKCLPTSKIPRARGNVLHDWHAEVLAIRAFNRFVLDECKALAQGRSSEFLRLRTAEEMASSIAPESPRKGDGNGWDGQPFAWKEDILLHMYCSEAPCGDASMELIMAAQEDATPWELPPISLSTVNPVPTTSNAGDTTISLPGRAFFSQLGVVRRKPARSDAPSTLSKSCSDKLALHQVTSLLSSVTTLLVNPRNVYLRTIVLPISRYDATSCRRAFSASEPDGRMRGLPSYLSPSPSPGSDEQAEVETQRPYAFHPFTVETSSSEFVFSQRSVVSSTSPSISTSTSGTEKDEEQKKDPKIVPSNLAAAWTLSGHEEATLGGVLQGRKQAAADTKGASFASRRRMWGLAFKIVNLLLEREEQGPQGEGLGAIERNSAMAEIQKALSSRTYGEVKDCNLLESRRRAKEEARAEALKGWARNLGDESFSLGT